MDEQHSHQLTAWLAAIALLAGGAIAAARSAPEPERSPPADVGDSAAAAVPGAIAPPRDDLVMAARKAVRAICEWPEEELRHDTAMGLVAVRDQIALGDLAPCVERIRKHALKDYDHPLAPLLDQEAGADIDLERIKQRPIPKAGERRVNVNTVVFRAVHCDRLPFDDEVWAYLTGPMRDEGGYHSTHALWALTFVRRHGCRPASAVDAAIESLRQELLRAQRAVTELATTKDIDLFAERLLFLAMVETPWAEIQPFVARFLAAQRTDGQFAATEEGRTRLALHATTLGAWASAVLSAWPPQKSATFTNVTIVAPELGSVIVQVGAVSGGNAGNTGIQIQGTQVIQGHC